MGAHILIVDDEEIIRDLLNRSLSREGYTTTVAANGRQGHEKFREEKFDLVISDILMPEMDGITMMEQIRKENTVTPIILITGYAKEYTARKAKELGAFDFIAKPFRNAEILQAVRKGLSDCAVAPQSAAPNTA